MGKGSKEGRVDGREGRRWEAGRRSKVGKQEREIEKEKEKRRTKGKQRNQPLTQAHRQEMSPRLRSSACRQTGKGIETCPVAVAFLIFFLRKFCVPAGGRTSRPLFDAVQRTLVCWEELGEGEGGRETSILSCSGSSCGRSQSLSLSLVLEEAQLSTSIPRAPTLHSTS